MILPLPWQDCMPLFEEIECIKMVVNIEHFLCSFLAHLPPSLSWGMFHFSFNVIPKIWCGLVVVLMIYRLMHFSFNFHLGFLYYPILTIVAYLDSSWYFILKRICLCSIHAFFFFLSCVRYWEASNFFSIVYFNIQPKIFFYE